MTATDILARFRRTIDSIEDDMEAEATEAEAPQSEPEPEPTTSEPESAPTPEANGHLVFELGKIGVSQGNRIKAALKAGEAGAETLVLVYAPSQGELETVFEALGVVV